MAAPGLHTAHGALAGTLLGLAGVGLVEALFLAGLKPAGPLGWPAVAMMAAAGFYGVYALLCAAAVATVYYLASASAPERFPEFFSGPQPSILWLAGIAIVCAVVIALRVRLVRAQNRAVLVEALRKSDEWLKLVTDRLPALVGYIDRYERFRLANRAYEEWFGLRREELVGRTVREAWGEERYRVIQPNLERALTGERVVYEYKFLDRHGCERQVLADYVPDVDRAGAVKGFFVLGTDVTMLEHTRRELRSANERLEQALEGSRAALWDTDLRSGRVYLSEAWAQIVGGPPRETVTTTRELMEAAHADDHDAIRRASVEVIKGTRSGYAVEHRVRSQTGEWRWILSRGRVTERDPASGRALRMIGMNLDITDRKRMEEALASVARTDPLTGLANRALLADRIQVAAGRARRSGNASALLYIDVDRFKQVNDTHGHAAGDALLKDFARRLQACVRQTDAVARLGGDEFVVVLEDLKERADAVRIAEKIAEQARSPGRHDGIQMSVSIGVAHALAGEDERAWLGRADAALYQAKQAGRNTVCIAD